MITYKNIEPFLKNPLNSLLKNIGDEFKQITQNKLIEYQVEEYNRNLYIKTLLHRTSPKKLTEIYLPLFIKHEDENIKVDSVKNVFSKSQFVTIIGGAGSGKSTIVKYCFIESIKSKFGIPIKIELRYLNDYNGSLLEYVRSEIFKFSELAESDTIADRLLNSGKFIFFLDGYDEIKSGVKEQKTKEIDDFVKKFNKNKYILTSRPYTNIDLLPLFRNYKVKELDDSEINEFISKQLPQTEKEVVEKIKISISREENKDYKSFLRNPLLLSMFILTYQSYSEIPQKKSIFYRQVFDTLFSLHDSMSKLAYVREKQSALPKEVFEEALSMLCFLSYFDEKFVFDKEYLTKILTTIKEKRKSLKFNNRKYIYDLQVAVGILIKEGMDFTFPHRSLQEYFAALYISKLNVNSKRKLYKKIVTKFLDEAKEAKEFSKGDRF